MKYRIWSMRIRGAAAAVAGFCLFLLAAPASSFAGTDWNVGISGGSHGIDGFHLSIGEYYDVPEKEVVVVHERGIDDDELPVVFYVARCAHVSPDMIVDMRVRGMSWMDITFHFGLEPDIYYVPVPVYAHHHPPYGNAWGYYGRYPHRNDWKRIRLSDADVVNQVNLRFMKDHYRYEPDRVMQYRAGGKRFAAIDRDIWLERHGKGHDHYYTDGNWRHGNDRSGDKGSQKQYSKKDGNRGPGDYRDEGSHGHGKGDKGKGGNKKWEEDNGGRGHN
jgi:hypothetical protein